LGIETPGRVDRVFLYSAKSLIRDYEEMYAKRIGVISDHARQAAAIAEAQGLKRGPSLENEIRAIGLATAKVIDALESLRHDA
jgi:hypothetical protein